MAAEATPPLRPGDCAPDFALPTVTREGTVSLPAAISPADSRNGSEMRAIPFIDHGAANRTSAAPAIRIPQLATSVDWATWPRLRPRSSFRPEGSSVFEESSSSSAMVHPLARPSRRDEHPPRGAEAIGEDQ
jgi:hypothetical protein